MRWLWAIVVGFLMSLVGCRASGGGGSSSDPVTCPAVERPPSVYQEVTATPVVSFSFRLFSEVWKFKRGPQPEGAKGWTEHGFLSPLSVWYVLLMLERGAEGGTLGGLLRAMGISLEEAPRVEDLFRRYREELLPSCGVDLRLLNGFWYRANDPDLRLVPEYLAFVRGYGAEPVPVLFTDRREVEEKINRWVTENTDGFLPSPFPDGVFPNADAALILVGNLLYFDGAWKKEVGMIVDGDKRLFYGLDGTQVVERWWKGGGVGVVDPGRYEVAWLPFVGEEYGFLLVEPQGGMDFGVWLEGLGEEWWLLWGAVQNGGKAFVILPAWEHQEKNIKLKGILGGMGDFDLWNQFGRMYSYSKPSEVKSLDQMVRVKVSDKGVRAAALTLAFFDIITFRPPPPGTYLVFDHPFFYAIVHRPTGLPLFMGVYLNPIPAELEKGS